MNTPWIEEHLDDLKRLWPEETAATIGGRIGKTRNAVIGMAHRLGLKTKTPGMNPSPRLVTRKPTLRPRKRVLKPRIAPMTAQVTVDVFPLAEGPVPLLEARPYHCRAIVQDKGEDGLAVFCGKPVVEGKAFSFCSDHFKQFTVKGSAR